MSHRKKNKKYVIIDAKFGNKDRFLGNRVHPGLSAAISWCEKHYPEESKELETNFSIRCIGHDKLTNIFMEEMRLRLPKNVTDRELLLSMAESLVHGCGIRVLSAAEKEKRLQERKNKKASQEAITEERSKMSRLFRNAISYVSSAMRK